MGDEGDTDPKRVREILVGDKHKNKNFIENGKRYDYLKVDVEYGYTPAERDVILVLTAKFAFLLQLTEKSFSSLGTYHHLRQDFLLILRQILGDAYVASIKFNSA